MTGTELIPHTAFESVCDIVGADSWVVSGGHAWLLVHPDSFDEVLASTIDVQVAEHGELRAASQGTEIERLLKETHLSKQDVRSLLESASPLWLLSDSASALASDLVLCRPTLLTDEISAIARNIESFDTGPNHHCRPGSSRPLGRQRRRADGQWPVDLQCVGGDLEPPTHRPPLVYRQRGVQLNSASWDALGQQLRTMVATESTPSPRVGPLGPVSVIVEGAGDRSIVKVVAPDEHGLLATICRYFQTHEVNIESLQAPQPPWRRP